MALRRHRNFELDVADDAAFVRRAYFERPLGIQNIVKAPGLGGQCGRITHFAAHGQQGEPGRARGGVRRRPGFARAGVRHHAIDVERMAVDEGVRQRIGDVFAVAAKQLRDDSG